MKAAKIVTNSGEAFRCLGDYFAGLDSIQRKSEREEALQEKNHIAGSQSTLDSWQDNRPEGDPTVRQPVLKEALGVSGRGIRSAQHRDIGRAVKCYQRAVTIDPLDSHAGV